MLLFFLSFFDRLANLSSKPLCGIWKSRRERAKRCWCYKRCFFWSADVATAAVLLLPCCCSCATLIMCVSSYSQVVQFHLGVGSCACILPQNLHFYCSVVPPVVAHLKKRKPWILKCIAQTKLKASKSRRRHRCCLCYAMLLLCYSHHLGLLCVPTAQIQRADSTQLYLWYQLFVAAHKIYVVRKYV